MRPTFNLNGDENAARATKQKADFILISECLNLEGGISEVNPRI